MEPRTRIAWPCRPLGLTILLALAVSLAAAQPVPTAVNCGILNADGSGVNGTIQISWPTFGSGGYTVEAGQLNFSVLNGACTPAISLIPTDTATGMLPFLSPAYTVKTNNGGKMTQAIWCIPTSGSPVGIESIQVAALPCHNVNSALSWAALTNPQWASLTNSQWTSLTN